MRNLLLFVFAFLLTHTASAQCQAGFTYSTNGLYVSFTNTSTPASGSGTVYVTKSIDFGVGMGSQLFPSSTGHTYSSAGSYLVIATIWVIDSSNSTYCYDNDSQWVSVTPAPCAVSISKTVNGNFVTFTANNLAGTSGMSYSWNFGDGNTGSGSPVTHTYATSGTYNVTLTGSSTSANCSKTDSTPVYIAPPPPNEITGMIVEDTTTYPDTFKVWLIQFDSSTNNLYAVDSTIVVGGAYYGSYAFNNIPAGIYRTKAAHLNGPTSGTGMIPTYHQSSLYWNTATLINHTGGTSNAWITMQTGTVTSGPGFVGGNVTLGANKGTGNGVEGQLVFLRDDNEAVLQMTYTDANGNYSFSNLPIGDYDVYPEEVGYATTPHSFKIEAGKTSINGIGFEKHDVSKVFTPVNTGVSEIAANTTLGIYPNPTSGEVYITLGTLDVKASITISDVTGRMVYQNNVNLKAGCAKLDMSDLQAGMYFMTVESNDVSATEKIVLKK